MTRTDVVEAEKLLRSRVNVEREHCIKHGRDLDIADVVEAARPLLEAISYRDEEIARLQHAYREASKNLCAEADRVAQLEAALRRIDSGYLDELYLGNESFRSIVRAALKGEP